MCKELKRLKLLAECPHLNKTDRDAVQWAIDNVSVVDIKEPVRIEGTPFYPMQLNAHAWELWITYRKKMKFKRYKTDAAMKDLSEMGSHIDQMTIVMISIKREYQGLFPLKGNGNGQNNGNTQGAGKKKSAYERAREANNEYRQPDERQVVMGADGRHLGGAVDEGERGAAIDIVGKSTFVDY